jgi:hypothetical protein
MLTIPCACRTIRDGADEARLGRCDPASPMLIEALMDEADRNMSAAKRRKGAGR